MHVTLHLTTSCNLHCDYCYAARQGEGCIMSAETARQAVHFAAESMSPQTGIIFFGGEPLLAKSVIRETVAECHRLEATDPARYHFHYKITTNGTLLDNEFLMYARENNITISLSIDGIELAHNTHRKDAGGKGSFAKVEAVAEKLLRYQPYANAMMVVNPATVSMYAESVKYLVEKGFKYIIASLNYAGEWTPAHLTELKKQYKLLAKYYRKLTLAQQKFFFSPFEMKFSTHIKGKEMLCTDCHLAQKQVSVAPGGDIYPCVQFVQDGVRNKDFVIGNVYDGFSSARSDIYTRSQVNPQACDECCLRGRCNFKCSCLNWQTTGIINEVSPVLCETERILIPIVDKLGEELFRRKAPGFIQKHYNTAYPIFSLIEDNRL